MMNRMAISEFWFGDFGEKMSVGKGAFVPSNFLVT